jgi:teichuronic acid biosynthesis glycosyltransferase TuaH
MMLDTDIVIITHQSAEHLAACITSVPTGLRTIVFDNASSDDSAAIAERLGCEVIRSGENIGFGRAVNRVIREHVQAGRVLLLNPDAQVDERSLHQLSAAMSDDRVAVAAPSLGKEDGSRQRPWWPFPSARGAWREAIGLHSLRPPDFTVTRDVDFVVGACFLVRTSAFRSVGGFDERYWLYGEEADLCRRLHDDGWKVRYVADAEARHIGGVSGRDRAELTAEHFIRGSERFVLTHEGTTALLSLRAATLVGAVLRLPMLRKNDPRRAVRARNLRRGARALVRHPTRIAIRDHSVAQPSLIVCSLEPWDTVWRRNQFLVQELTDNDPSLRVLFVEPAIDPLHELKAGRRPPVGRGRRLRPVADRPQIIRFQPVKLLPRLLGGWADRSLARQINRAVGQAEMVDPTLWINDLDLTGLALGVNWPVLYDVTDDWLLASVPRRVSKARRTRESALLDRADEVVVCSRGLQNTKGAARAVTVITNAVDADRFRTTQPRPRDLPRQATAVYVGTLHEDRLDIELVCRAARALPGINFVFVGPSALSAASTSRLAWHRNVTLLGARPYDDVPAYLQHATVLIVPHVVTSFTESLDPIKAYECLAVGRPTLATPVAGFRDLGPGIGVATSEEFVNELRLLLDQDVDATSPVSLPTWREQADRFAQALDRARLTFHSRPTRVAFIDHVARISGGELALVRLLPELIASGVAPTVILGETGPLEQRLREVGAVVEILPIDPSIRDRRRGQVFARASLLRGGITTARYTWRLRGRLRAINADIVHTNSLKAHVYGGVAGRLAGVPVVWHVRDRIARDYLPAGTVRVIRALARIIPAAIVANSQATAATIRSKTTTVYNVYEAQQRPRPILDFSTVAIIGRLSPWKGQHVVLEAFAKAFPDGTERCVIVGSALFGEAEYELALQRLVGDLGITSRVEFRGHVDDIETMLMEVDVLVHASTTPEPFGQVILEAIAAGVPVIATDAGGAREIIKHEVSGLLTPPGDVRALARALRRVADDTDLRANLAAGGLRRATDFLPGTRAADYIGIYDRVRE